MNDDMERDAEAPPASGMKGRLRGAVDGVRAAVVRLSLRASPSEAQRVFGLTLLLGGVCGVVAVAFHLAIQGAERLLSIRSTTPEGWTWIPWVVLTPAVGGTIAGVILHRFAPNAAGSGIPQIKTAYALDTSGTRLRDAAAKFIVCVLQLGSGASLGREGPTVQICAAVATSVGRWLALSPANLRRLIPVGAAAGVAAAFNAPIAAVAFTIEEIAEGAGERAAGDVARRKEHAAPDEPLLRAVARMQRLGVRQLPVLERGSPTLIGMLAMSDVLRAQVRSEQGGDAATSADRGSTVPDEDPHDLTGRVRLPADAPPKESS